MKLNAIHHVAIIVSDIQAAKDFYVNKLGFEVIRENYREERKDWKLDLKIGEGAEAVELEIFAAQTYQPPRGLRSASSGIPCRGCGGSRCRTGKVWN